MNPNALQTAEAARTIPQERPLDQARAWQEFAVALEIELTDRLARLEETNKGLRAELDKRGAVLPTQLITNVQT